jgi:solute carrier family 50 protein (sugar transporter)
MTVLLESLRVLTTCSSVLLNVSPWPEFARINRQRTPGPLTVLPVVMLFCNSFLWTLYGFMVGQLFPLFATCSMGQCTCAGFIFIYYRWSPDRAAVRRLVAKAGSVMALCMAYVVLGAHGLTNQTREQVITTLALMCISVNICLYASPLDTMKRVVQTKSAASLPISLCTVNLINGLLWVAFGITEGDYYVLTPNAIGSVLSAAQVALYFTYCATDESRHEEAEIQAAVAALETVSKSSSMRSTSSYGSVNKAASVTSFVPHAYHSVVDVHEKEPLLVAAAN